MRHLSIPFALTLLAVPAVALAGEPTAAPATPAATAAPAAAPAVAPVATTTSVAPAAAPVAAAGASAPAAATRVSHVPVNELESGAAELHFEVREPDRAGVIVVRWSVDREAFGETRAYRGDLDWVATVPAEVVQPPGFTYWVVERGADGSELPVFASAVDPHRVYVYHDEELRRELARLDARGGERSTLFASGEYVDFGDRRLLAGTADVHDRYYRLEAGYAYAFLSRVEDVQLSVVHVRGEAAELGTVFENGAAVRGITALEPGIDYGRAQVTLLGTETVRVRGSLLLGASQEGFEYGGGGALIFGDPLRTHVALTSEVISTLGFTAGMRMAFSASERVPMGAAVELTNFPVNADAGVRLLYDVGWAFAPASALYLRAGFQGRTSVTGGLSLGGGLRYSF